jgi:hypothetical protein
MDKGNLDTGSFPTLLFRKFESMEGSTKKLPDLSRRIIEVIEKEYDWNSENGHILLQETKDLIVALEGLGFTGRQILAELVENGNIEYLPII